MEERLEAEPSLNERRQKDYGQALTDTIWPDCSGEFGMGNLLGEESKTLEPFKGQKIIDALDSSNITEEQVKAIAKYGQKTNKEVGKHTLPNFIANSHLRRGTAIYLLALSTGFIRFHIDVGENSRDTEHRIRQFTSLIDKEGVPQEIKDRLQKGIDAIK
jgi:hypothetical protein